MFVPVRAATATPGSTVRHQGLSPLSPELAPRPDEQDTQIRKEKP